MGPDGDSTQPGWQELAEHLLVLLVLLRAGRAAPTADGLAESLNSLPKPRLAKVLRNLADADLITWPAPAKEGLISVPPDLASRSCLEIAERLGLGFELTPVLARDWRLEDPLHALQLQLRLLTLSGVRRHLAAVTLGDLLPHE